MNSLSFGSLSGMTVSEFLSGFHLAKTVQYKLIKSHSILVNGQTVSASYRMQEKDVLSVILDDYEENTTDSWSHDLNIVYEDEDILIVNKPVSMLVHPDGSETHTLANAVADYYRKKNLERKVRHVHRIDYDTSGLVLFAKHFLAHSDLDYQIEHRIFEKIYLAEVLGHMEEASGVIGFPIGRDRHHSNRYRVSPSGKEALTRYEVVAETKEKSLLKVRIETGRTHQIRVHMAYIGHPILGDAMYGKPGGRLMLHSYQVSFFHPRTKSRVTFRTGYPDEFMMKGYRES